MNKHLFSRVLRIFLSLCAILLVVGGFLRYSDSAFSQQKITDDGTLVFGPLKNGPEQGRPASFAESGPVKELPLAKHLPLGLDEQALTRKQLARRKSSLFKRIDVNPTNRNPIRTYTPSNGAGLVENFVDAALAPFDGRLAPDAPMPGPTITFDSPNAGGGIVPPDTVGDVGLTQYVQMTNGNSGTPVTVFNKTTGAVTAGPFFLETLWPAGDPCSTTPPTAGDPIVNYDPLADRWILSQFTFSQTGPPNYLCFAISRTGDAGGSYFLYSFEMPNAIFQDYPHYSVWPDGYYVTANQFDVNDDFNGVGLFALDRNRLLLGDPNATFIYFNKNEGCGTTACQFGGFLPTDFDGVEAPPAGLPNLSLTFNADEFGATDRLEGFLFKPDYDTPGNSTLVEINNIPLAAFDARFPTGSRQAIEQFEGQPLDAVADRLMHRLAYRNLGTQSAPINAFVGNFTVNVSGVAPTDPGTYQAAPRWFELRGTDLLAGPGGITLYDEGTHSPDAGNGASGVNRWMSSIAQDHQGRIALGYSASSSTQRANIAWAGRETGAATGVLNATETTFYAANGSQTTNSARWGDYSAMTTDPTDDCTFYYTQEVYNATSAGTWDSRIGYGKFPACTDVPKGNISGTITACGTGAPLPGAIVTATGGFNRVTAAPGTFSLITAPGTYTVAATAIGYSTVSQNGVVVANGGNAAANLCLTAVPVLNPGAVTLVSESCQPANGAVDPGETVTVALGVTNTGNANTVNDVGTLQATGGVLSPGAAQNYGVIVAGGAAVSRNFTFTADPNLACGAPITATVAHVDTSGSLGNVNYTIPTGAVSTIFTENFDGVTAPALPAGWTAVNATGPAPTWVTATGSNDTPPNVAFVDEPVVISDKRLDSPAIMMQSSGQVTFRHSYNFEETYDGGVLEISIAGVAQGQFRDIIAAGGSFVTGGYTGLMSTISQSPIGGRMAWTGLQSQFITTTVNLPASANGRSVVLRFRAASDESLAASPAPGWRVDTVSVTGRSCCFDGPPPTPTPTPTCTPGDAITDGGFEANTGNPATNPNWISTSTAYGSSLCALPGCGTAGGQTPPRTGNGWLWFDGTGDGDVAESGTATQTVFLYPGTATLRYYLRIGQVTTPANSVLTVTVDGTVVQTINEPATPESAYTERTVDLSAYANGASHVIQFNYSRPGGTTGSDSFTIDDVSLQTTCSIVPTTATVSGQVRDANNRGIGNLSIVMIDPQGAKRFVTTTSFGTYTFINVPTGADYSITPVSKRYRFGPPRIVTVNGDLTGINFMEIVL